MQVSACMNTGRDTRESAESAESTKSIGGAETVRTHCWRPVTSPGTYSGLSTWRDDGTLPRLPIPSSPNVRALATAHFGSESMFLF